MIGLKHMILALAAAVMIAGPAMSCCMPDDSSAAVMSEVVHDEPSSNHNKQTASAAGHPCDEQSNTASEHHSTVSENDNNGCTGCADCTYMTAKAKVQFSAIQIKVDYEPEQLNQAQAIEILAQPPLLAKFIRPPATAPPLSLSLVHLKQILIV